jgi:hypothetical protein
MHVESHGDFIETSDVMVAKNAVTDHIPGAKDRILTNFEWLTPNGRSENEQHTGRDL